MTALIREERHGSVALVQLDRPEARNALSPEMMDEIGAALERLDHDDEVRAIVIAGSDEVFAAGADIRALRDRTFGEALFHPTSVFWKRVASCRTPLIAGVSGFALGGGCELALACDMIVASETAEFGQPEITLGIIPGGVGAQSLSCLLEKQRTMELVLPGRRFDARQAVEWGFVNKFDKAWLNAAIDLGHVVSSGPPMAAKLGKQAVLAADES